MLVDLSPLLPSLLHQHGGRKDRLLHCAGCYAGYGRVWRSGGHLQLCQDPLLSTNQHDPDWSKWGSCFEVRAAPLTRSPDLIFTVWSCWKPIFSLVSTIIRLFYTQLKRYAFKISRNNLKVLHQNQSCWVGSCKNASSVVVRHFYSDQTVALTGRLWWGHRGVQGQSLLEVVQREPVNQFRGNTWTTPLKSLYFDRKLTGQMQFVTPEPEHVSSSHVDLWQLHKALTGVSGHQSSERRCSGKKTEHWLGLQIIWLPL